MSLTDGLLLHYKFEGNATDSSGNGNHGTAINTPSYSAGRIGNGIAVVSSSTQHAAVPDLTAQCGDNMSANIWLRCTEATPADPYQTGLWNFGAHIDVAMTHYPYINGLGYFGTFRMTSNTTVSRVDAVTLPVGVDRTALHMLTITTTPGANGWKLWINATEVVAATGITGIFYDSDIWSFGFSGADGVANVLFNGLFDEASLWHRTITPAEITQLYNSGSGRSFPWSVAGFASLYATAFTSIYE